VDKYDYSNHPETKKLISCRASEYISYRPEFEAEIDNISESKDKTSYNRQKFLHIKGLSLNINVTTEMQGGNYVES
jgi:hypothetical protein